MGHCNSRYLTSCVKTEDDDTNYLHYICRIGSVYDLMEISLFVKNSGHLIHKYDEQGRQCTHIVAMYDGKNAVKKISLLVKMGADINARELQNGNSLLHIAVNRRNYELAEWLCQESNVIGGAINYVLQIPYHLAYYACDQKMMNLLKTNGAACDDPVNGEISDDE